jgi:hypothetical protein
MGVGIETGVSLTSDLVARLSESEVRVENFKVVVFLFWSQTMTIEN